MPSSHPPPPSDPSSAAPLGERLREIRIAFHQVPATLALIFKADRGDSLILTGLTALSALLPAGIAWTGKLIVDAVVAAGRGQGVPGRVSAYVVLELGLMAGLMVAGRLVGLERDLLRARLSNAVNEKILEKALDLELRHFEDSEVYDKLQNARREAASRPLSLVLQAFTIAQYAITLGALSALLLRLSPWSVLVVVASSVPAFFSEARLAAASFRLNSGRAPEERHLNYLEWILTRDSHVQEVKVFGLGPLVLSRYRSLFSKFFDEDRPLAIRRMALGVLFGLVSLGAIYAMYGTVAARAARAEVSLGDLTLYLVVFRQGQGAVQSILTAMGAMYEDALYMSNLFTFLTIPTGGELPRRSPALAPARGRPGRIELDHVSFRYPGRSDWALRDFTLTLEPGEKLGLVGENGAGKSTLVKLLLRLYQPSEGAIRYGGIDLRDMDVTDLRSRVGAVFQDFVRYQFTAAENIGVGSPDHLDDRPRIVEAARRGGAASLVEALPHGYDTILGGWFEAGHELSAGQWQKLAVARAFMPEQAEVLILDEPTASIDAEAEYELFERLRALAVDRTAIVISHRFSTIRTMADRIAVLRGGRLEEIGNHQELIERNGRYAQLFRLQARGYLG